MAWLGTVVAERKLENADRPKTAAALRIAMPKKRRTGEFECRYEIRGFGAAQRGRALGVDGLQALELAIGAARKQLQGMPTATSFGMPAYLALPVVAGSTLPKKFADRLERAVKRVYESFGREARKKHEATNRGERSR